MAFRHAFMTTAAVSILALGAVTPSASTETYPSRPITVINPFAAGGSSAAALRIMEPRMTALLGQPLVIESVSGAAGTIATGRLVRSAPDGYTIGIGQWDTLVLNGAMYALPYDVQADVQPIALLA